MNSMVVDFAGVVFKVNYLYPETKAFCKDYICNKDYRYEVTLLEKDIRWESKKAKFHCSDKQFERLALQRKVSDILINEDVLLFHSSVIQVDGDAYVFAAPSGTGKSTHTRLWREYLKDQDVHMINDDKPFIKVGNEIIAYGTPWKGKEGIGENRKSRVKAICFLSQSNTNTICSMEKEKILPLLLRQTYKNSDKNELVRTVYLLNQIAEEVPVYKMECNASLEAAKLSYECMSGL